MLPVAKPKNSPYPAPSNEGHVMSRIPVWVVPLVAAATFGLGLVVGGVGGLVFARTPAATNAPAAPAAKPLTRGEFDRLVVGKTADEVLAAVGKPDQTQSGTGGSEVWYYRNRTVDEVTGKTDFSAQVVFERGRVNRVNH